MGRFFSNKNDLNDLNNDEPQDFVLSPEEPSAESVESAGFIHNEDDMQNDDSADFHFDSDADTPDFSETAKLPTVSNISDISINGSGKPAKRFFEGFSNFTKKNKAVAIGICSVLILSVIGGASWGLIASANPLRSYVQAAAAKENIIYTLDVDGTLNSGDKYNIMSLVSGKIAESNVEVGDTVKAGDILYKLDDTEAKLSVERAKNELDRAKNTTSDTSSSTGRIIATDTGTIQTLNIKQGSSVTAGSQIGTLKKDDGAIVPIVSYVSGTVSVLNVQTGRQVSNNQLIASVKLSTSASSSGNTEYDKKSSEIDVQAAQKQLEHYTIKSPTDGIVIEKNNRVGDNIGTADSYKPLMVVMDTSSLTMTASVSDEWINDVKKGQSVTITSPSIPDTTFSGEVSYVSPEGKTGDDNKIYFDIKITISEPGDLKAGMSATARIILSSENNALSVPQSALLKTDGQNALVLVKSEDNGDDTDMSESIENALNNPDIKIPKNCELKSVKYGISDGNNVHIISGINLGDIVVYNPKNNATEFIKSTIISSDSSKDTDDDDYFSDDYADDESQSGDDVTDDLKDKINDILDNV